MHAFRDWRVSARINAGFGAVLALLALVAAVSYWGLLDSAGGLDRYAGQVGAKAAALESEAAFLDVKVAVREYIAKNTDARFQIAREKFEAARAAVLAKKAATSDPDVAAKLDALTGLLDAYWDGFAALAETRRTRNAAFAEMREAAVALHGDLNAQTLAAAEAGRPMLAKRFAQADVAVWKFMDAANQFAAEAEESVRAEAVAQNEAVFAALAAAQAEGADAGRLSAWRAQAETMRSDFEKVGALTAENRRQDREIVEMKGGEIAAGIEAIAGDATKAADATKKEVGAAVAFALVVAGVATAVALLGGAAFAWIIGRGIAGPVVQMTGAMERLAGGALDTDIPGRGRKDEIGGMAAAVQVFKENALRVKAMEAEQAELKRRAEEEKRRMMNEMADEFERKVATIVGGVSSAATQL